jgi:hypothetical protein
MASTSGRLHSEFVRLLFLQTHRETDRFFAASGVQLAPTHPGGQFTFLRRNDAVQGRKHAEVVGRKGKDIPPAPADIDLQGLFSFFAPVVGSKDQRRRSACLYKGFPGRQREPALEGAVLLALQSGLFQVTGGTNGDTVYTAMDVRVSHEMILGGFSTDLMIFAGASSPIPFLELINSEGNSRW